MLNKDFKEFIKLLNKHDVKYLVVGGYALALHGHPRYTKDIDIWVLVDEENAHKIIGSLKEFGFESLELSIDDFLKPGYVIQLGQPPSRIDILTSATALEFSDCYPQRMEIMVDDIKVHFIDLINFKINKQATGRLQDLADLEKLK